jgi:hypothetical protein
VPPHRCSCRAYDKAAREIRGSKAICNFPDDDTMGHDVGYLSRSYGSYSSSPLGSTPPVFGMSPGGYSPSPHSTSALQHMADAAAALYAGKSNLGEAAGRDGSEEKDEPMDMNCDVDEELAEMADALLLLHESA